MSDKIKVMSVFGTRPEAVKMCPLVIELCSRTRIKSLVALTGQHRSMLDSVMTAFGVDADYDLDIMRPNQTPTDIAANVMLGLDGILREEKPDLVLVHGDTTTSFAAALTAFHLQIPVGHVEAGLRTYDKYSPFPEEMNRTLTGKIASLHFAPTEKNKQNLIREGVSERDIYVTGNTVIDSFRYTVSDDYKFECEALGKIDFRKYKTVVLTAHRRENHGDGIESICRAVTALEERFPDVLFIYPVHLSPAVRDTVFPILCGHERIILTDPLSLSDMHNLIKRSYMVLTDSGGIQEEAPSLGSPVLVLRTETERPEAVEAGTVKVIGTNANDIVREASLLLRDADEYSRMAKSVNPYGDGHASERIADAIISYFSQS
ncbi:MAG: UDP-N-acetylglucosamine 2-epimerase (non-hydrolyzing) [Firmicutes bacterium]|nr:UDP-N-acetylglucosamine 2-epimerase (non-hydrolyzing) [Bacillota bacterium]